MILPVNASARSYDPVLDADVDVFESGYADAAGEAEAALAGSGCRGATYTAGSP